jgi:hypothetical protein
MLVEVLTTAASWHSEQPLLTYSVPQALEQMLRVGQLVAVPYGERLVEGITWQILPDDARSNSTAGTDDALLQNNLDTSAGTDLSCPRLPVEWFPGHDKSVPAEVSELFISSA